MKSSIKTGLAAILLLAISCTKQNSNISSGIAAQSLDNSVTANVNVGDTLQGGIVFYVDSTKIHGLIVAFQNQGRVAWYNGEFTVTKAKGRAIGTGAENTRKIIISQRKGIYAATLSVSYTGGGYSDWFLPSKGELDKLYKNKDVVTGLGSFFYWSSTEIDSTKAWSQSFYNGAQSSKAKGGQLYVRAIRAF